MKKFVLTLVILILITAIAVAGYFGYTQITQSKAASTIQTGIALPSLLVNPFIEKPASGFGGASMVQTLFTEPTPTYQNPFGSTRSGNPSYQNPFEALR